MSNTVKYEATAFPYAQDFAPFLTHHQLLRLADICVKNIATYSGFGIAQHDAGYADKRQALYHTVEEDLNTALCMTNALLLLNSNNRIESIKLAKEAIMTGHHLINTMEITPNEEDDLRSVCGDYDVDYIDYSRGFDLIDQAYLSESTGIKREHVPVPIIAVGELLPGLHGTDVALSLYTHFSKKGYHVLPLLSDPYAGLVCRYTIHEIFDKNIHIVEKINLLNRWFMEVCYRESPDLIVLQMPGDLVAINNHVKSTHGLYAYLLSQSIAIDAFALCIPCDFIDGDDAFAEVNRLLHYRFALSPDSVFVSNKKPDIASLAVRHEVEYLHLSYELVSDYAEQLRRSTEIHLCTMADMTSLCQKIENVLSQYGMADPIT